VRRPLPAARSSGVALAVAFTVPFVSGLACGSRRVEEKPDPRAVAAVSSETVSDSAAPPASAELEASTLDGASDASPEAAKPRLASKWTLTTIYERPDMGSLIIGWLRAGSGVVRSADPVPAGKGAVPCGGTWYAVEPAGYLCDGQSGVTSDLSDPAVVAAAQFPVDESQPLPFGYGMSYGTPLYARVPNAAEQHNVEGDVEGYIKQRQDQYAKMPAEKRPPPTAMPIGPMPDFLQDGAQAPVIVPWLSGKRPLMGGYAIPDTRLAFVAAFDVEGRVFYLTTENLVVPADRFRAARLADFHGVELAKEGEPGEHLPMAWARVAAPIWHIEPVEGKAGELKVTATSSQIPRQGHAEVVATSVRIGGSRYLELTNALAVDETLQAGERYAVKLNDVARLEAEKELPPNVDPDEVWIDVSLERQALVVYEGTAPIYTTLLSSGAGGKNRQTPLGTFRIYAKHLTSRMSQDEKPAEVEGEEAEKAYRFDDVPWVEYFHEGIGFHAAFWHDAFGQPHSHGCLNLSPRDALWMFHHTLPNLPPGWHGVNAGARWGIPAGTTVVIHH
jgi:lipoprotein-anchoring transpeptidase ErfK/SrfK